MHLTVLIMQHSNNDGSRRVKNIAAILYLLVLMFLVGGSFIHQQSNEKSVDQVSEQVNPEIIVHQ